MDFGVLSSESVRDYIAALLATARRGIRETADDGDEDDMCSPSHVAWAGAGAGAGTAALDLEVDDGDSGFVTLSSPVTRAPLRSSEACLTRIIATAHEFVRVTLGEGSVSQRDLHRVMKSCNFFLGHTVARARRQDAHSRALVDHEMLVRCMLLAVGIVYYLRLSREQRTTLGMHLHEVSSNSIELALTEEIEE
jgi:hypothetical protein